MPLSPAPEGIRQPRPAPPQCGHKVSVLRGAAGEGTPPGSRGAGSCSTSVPRKWSEAPSARLPPGGCPQCPSAQLSCFAHLGRTCSCFGRGEMVGGPFCSELCSDKIHSDFLPGGEGTEEKRWGGGKGIKRGEKDQEQEVAEKGKEWREKEV